MSMRSVRTVRRFALGIVLALVVAACGTTSTPTLYALSVTVGGTGDGTVTSAPAGIDTAVAGGNQADFEDGTAVTLTATAAAGSTFTGWGGACASAVGATCDVTVDAAQSVTATFDQVVHSLTVAVDGTGSGAVTSTPSGIDTSVAGGEQADFAGGSVVTLTATADAGSEFAGWGGACATAVGTTCDVEMSADRNAFATFDLIVGSIDLTIGGLPVGATPSVRITGPDAYDETFTSDATVSLPPGSYTVAPAPVSDAPAVYRSRAQVVNVVADATSNVTVTYEQPSVLLYYDTIGAAEDNVSPALTANGFAVTQTTVAATFDTEVASGDHDLVIAMVQGSAPAMDLPTLTSYVDGGGRAIGATFSQTAGFADVFDASFTGATNLTTADLDAPALAEGITDPIELENPTYGIYSTGLAADVGASSLCTFENDDSCVVSGNGGRTAMLGFLMDTIPGADDQTFWESLSLFVLGY